MSFGFSGISLSDTGDILVVGDQTKISNSIGSSSPQIGEVYIARRENNWAITQTITPPLTASDQTFGSDLQLTPNGAVLAIGAKQYGEILTNPGVSIQFSTDALGAVSSVVIQGGHSEKGFAAFGTFSITTASDAGHVGTNATISYSGIQSIITSVTITAGGSGFTPLLTNVEVALPDLPTRTVEQVLWPAVEGSAVTTLVERDGVGKIYLYDYTDNQYLPSLNAELLTRIPDGPPLVGIGVDITADGNTVAIAGVVEPYLNAGRLSTGKLNTGMSVIFERVTPRVVTEEVRYYTAEINPSGVLSSDLYLPSIVSTGPPRYGFSHALSEDGNTLVIGSKQVGGTIDVYVASNGGWTWTLQTSLSIPQNTTLQSVSVDATGWKIVAYVRNEDPMLQNYPNAEERILTWTNTIGPDGTYLYFNGVMGQLCRPLLSPDGTRMFHSFVQSYWQINFNTNTEVNGTSNVITVQNVPINTGTPVRYNKNTGTGDIGLIDQTVYYLRLITPLNEQPGEFTLHPTYIDSINDTNSIDIFPTATPETHFIMEVGDTPQRVLSYEEGGIDPWNRDPGEIQPQPTGIEPTYGFGSSMSCSRDGKILAIASATRAEPSMPDDPASGSRQRSLTLYEYYTGEGSGFQMIMSFKDGPYSAMYDTIPAFTSLSLVSVDATVNNILCIDRALNHAYVAERSDFTTNAYVWKQLLQSNTPLLDVGFGGSEDHTIRGGAISSDGTTIVIGAWKEAVGNVPNAGGLYVFKRIDEVWRLEQHIPAPTPITNGSFGVTVCISGNGKIVTVSQEDPDHNTGKVQVFSLLDPPVVSTTSTGSIPIESNTNTYVANTIVSPSVSSSYLYFGADVAVDATGDRILAAGAETKVMKLTGGEWIQEQELVPSNLSLLADRVASGYGQSCAINSTGTVAVVTAPYIPNGINDGVGQATVFTRTGTVWSEYTTLVPSDIIDFMSFGTSVAMNSTGTVIVITVNDAQSTYLFRNVSGSWTELKIVGDPDALFGAGVSYVDNGTDQGILAVQYVSSIADPNPTKIRFYEHVYGTPDTVTLGYTSTFDPNDAYNPGGTTRGLKFSSDKGQYLVVGDPGWYRGVDTTGQVLVLKNSTLIGSDRDPAGPWEWVATIVPPDLAAYPLFLQNWWSTSSLSFGESVDITAGGTHILISAPYFSPPDVLDPYNAKLFEGGVAWVLERGVDEWMWSPVTSRRVFTPSPIGQQLGTSAAFTDNLDVVVLGGRYHSHIDLNNEGSEVFSVGEVQIFKYEPVTTAPRYSFTETFLEDYNVSGGVGYGQGSHAVSKDGTTLAVGYGLGTNPFVDVYNQVGAVWVFESRIDVSTNITRIKLSETGNTMVCCGTNGTFVTLTRTGAVWNIVDTFTPPGTPYTQEFELSRDASTLFVSTNNGTHQYIIVYVWNVGTTSWDVEDDTTISAGNVLDFNTIGGTALDFGTGMSSSSTGDWFVVTGLRYISLFNMFTSPAGYVYHRSGGNWSLFSIEASYLTTQETLPAGQNIMTRMSDDGTKFLISCAALNRVWLFERDSTTDHHFPCTAKLTYEDSTSIGGEDRFGDRWTIDMSDDATYIIAGGPNWNSNIGRAIMWHKIDGQWRPERLFYNTVGTGSQFGKSVTCNATADLITISDGYSDIDLPNGGGVWVFKKSTLANLAILPITLPNGQQLESYNATITSTGGTGPYTYIVTEGSLPPGVTLSEGGTLVGKPTEYGNYSFTIKAIDLFLVEATRSYAISVSRAPSMILFPSTLSDCLEGDSYPRYMFFTYGGLPPYSYTVTSGTLPPGLSLAVEGDLLGIPTTAGTFSFSITSEDSTAATITNNYTVEITTPVVYIELSSIPLNPGYQFESYSDQITASGGTGPYTYVITSGLLPPGLNMSSAGEISGTITAYGTFGFVVTATDSLGASGYRSYSITSYRAPVTITISPTTLPSAIRHISYSQTVVAAGGTGPYTYAVTAGVLPFGLSLSTDGTLDGTPTTTGSFTFSITATDSTSLQETQLYILTVNLGWLTIPSQVLVSGVPFTLDLSTYAPAGTTGYALYPGFSLPTGISLNTTTGLVSGTPSITETVVVRFNATV